MKVEVKKLDSLKRELRFEVPKERVSVKLNEVYDEIGKVAKVKGFRQGKVPRHILENQHRQTAEEETIKKLIPEVYQEGLKKENISPIDLPEILNINLKNGILTFTAKLDIRPDVKVKDYKQIKIKRKSSAVTEEDLNKTLDFIKKGRGDDKEVTLDDALAHSLGYPNLDDFKKAITRQLEIDKDRHNRIDVENQIVEHLLAKTKVDVPESLVNRQLHHRQEDHKKHLKSQGFKDEDIKKKQEEVQKDLKESVIKDIKVYLILERIAQEEKLDVKEGENVPAKVMEFLLKEAKWEEAK